MDYLDFLDLFYFDLLYQCKIKFVILDFFSRAFVFVFFSLLHRRLKHGHFTDNDDRCKL